MSDVIDVPADIEPEPIEIETCALCGCAIEDLEELIHLRAADLVTRWESADPRDAWRHTGEHPPRSTGSDEEPVPRAPPYRPAASTVSAFRYLVATGDVERLRRWLGDRPKDAPHLLLLLESRDNAQAL